NPSRWSDGRSGATGALGWGVLAALVATGSSFSRHRGLAPGVPFPAEITTYLLLSPLTGFIAGGLTQSVHSSTGAAIAGVLAGAPFAVFVLYVLYRTRPPLSGTGVVFWLFVVTGATLLCAVGGVAYFTGVATGRRRGQHGA